MSNQQLHRCRHRSGVGRATGFELAGPGQRRAANIDSALAAQPRLRRRRRPRGRRRVSQPAPVRDHLPRPRVDPAHFLGLGLSDAMVVRNVGGRVTPEVIDDVAFIAQLAESVLPDGPLFEVAVIHHTQCGTGALADDTFRRRYAERIGADESTLREHAVLDPAATVTRDVERLRSAPAIPARVTVSGHVYDVVTGLVETVIPASEAEPAMPSGDRRSRAGTSCPSRPTNLRTCCEPAHRAEDFRTRQPAEELRDDWQG